MALSMKTISSFPLSQSLPSWNYEPHPVGPPKIDRSWWRILTKRPLEKGMVSHFSILWRTPWTVWKDKKNRTLNDDLPRSVGAQYATGDQWRNNPQKNEETEKEKQHPVVDVIGDGNKDQHCKKQYCIGTCNVRSMNQGKLEIVKQEMARVNVDILGISKLKWTGMTIISTTVGRNPLEEME